MSLSRPGARINLAASGVERMSNETREVLNEAFTHGVRVALDALGYNAQFSGTFTLECNNGKVVKVKPSFVL